MPSWMRTFTPRFARTLVWVSLLGAYPASATTTLVNFSKNFYTVENVDATTQRIYAGRTANSCVGPDVNTPCNSCLNSGSIATQPFSAFYAGGTVPEVCSDYEVWSGLRFTVTLKSDQSNAYVACSSPIIAKIDSSVVPSQTNDPVTPGELGRDVTATFGWTDICSAAGISGCTGSRKFTLTVGFANNCATSGDPVDGSVKFEIRFRYAADSNPATLDCGSGLKGLEGLCLFTVYPGDEKVFVNNIGAENGNALRVPNYTTDAAVSATSLVGDDSEIIYKAARFYGVAGNIANETMSSTLKSNPDLPYTLGGGLGINTVEGLENGQTYQWVMASVDQAGIVSQFTPPVAAKYAAGQEPGTAWVATPEPVLGLLDGKKCFIATAAFNSEMASEVVTLREFRDKILKKNSVGLWFVKRYYEFSPPLARFIAEHEAVRTWTRSQLWAVVAAAELWLLLGTLPLLIFVGFAGLLLLRLFGRSR